MRSLFAITTTAIISLTSLTIATSSIDYTEIKASSKACFSSADYSVSTMFPAPYNGTIVGVRFVHLSGQVSCSTGNYDNWGCGGNHDRIFTSFVKVNVNNSVIESLYPTDDTNDVTSISYANDASCECSVIVWYSDTYLGNSTEITLISEVPSSQYSVTTEDLFALKYCEADCEQTISDNDGTSCAEVYLLYSEIDSDLIEVEASSNACWNGADSSTATMFNAPLDGTLAGIRLLHNSGAITCNYNSGYSYWGCIATYDYDRDGIWSNLVRVDSNNNAQYSLYPTDDTKYIDEIATFSTCGCQTQWATFTNNNLNRDSINSANGTTFVLLSDTIEYKVTTDTDELYSMHFCEADCDHTVTDNAGTTCATVYFLYSAFPTQVPSAMPSCEPTTQPSNEPSFLPSIEPSGQPTTQPSSQPSNQPTTVPSANPSTNPSTNPSNNPSMVPSSMPSSMPSGIPSSIPSHIPSYTPSSIPSSIPSNNPSNDPSTMEPSSQPTYAPSMEPTIEIIPQTTILLTSETSETSIGGTTSEPSSNGGVIITTDGDREGSNSNGNNNNDGGLSSSDGIIYAVIGLGFGILCCLVCILAFALFYTRKKHKKTKEKQALQVDNMEESSNGATMQMADLQSNSALSLVSTSTAPVATNGNVRAGSVRSASNASAGGADGDLWNVLLAPQPKIGTSSTAGGVGGVGGPNDDMLGEGVAGGVGNGVPGGVGGGGCEGINANATTIAIGGNGVDIDGNWREWTHEEFVVYLRKEMLQCDIDSNLIDRFMIDVSRLKINGNIIQLLQSNPQMLKKFESNMGDKHPQNVWFVFQLAVDSLK